MDRQHWINLAYKLCFWEEEQVHGSQINQITKSDQVCTLKDYQCTTRFLPKLSRKKKQNKTKKAKPQTCETKNTFIPLVPSLVSPR
jgi:hypothetical protein